MQESEIDRLLQRARLRIAPRVSASDLAAEMDAGALVVDTRCQDLRQRDGELPGAVVVERNVLEWRLDPTSPHRMPELAGADQRVIIVCDEGYASSLAADTLRSLGLRDVTDLAGGFQAWKRRLHPARPRPQSGYPAVWHPRSERTG